MSGRGFIKEQVCSAFILHLVLIGAEAKIQIQTDTSRGDVIVKNLDL